MTAAQVPTPGDPPSALSVIDDWLARNGERLVGIRRDLHSHPEVGWQERRTTAQLEAALGAAGLTTQRLPRGTGLICDIGENPRLAVRADIDALPIADTKQVPYRSMVEGIAHACGHDVHTTVVTGVALLAARLYGLGLLPAPIRVVFQPAEELMPGGALEVLRSGGLDGIEQILAVHCDPTLPVGTVGLAEGPITAASDHVEVRLSGPGGHTARPHLTADLVSALAEVVAQAPAALARRVDPRSGTSVVWGRISAGTAANVIPQEGVAAGTLRTLDAAAWQAAPPLLASIVREIGSAWGVAAELLHEQGVPPVVNTAEGVGLLRRGLRLLLDPGAETDTAQSLGGEDFGWYLRDHSGAMARLGVRPPSATDAVDLHRSAFDVDESSIEVGVRLLLGAALSFA
jgi:amidohydrolase